MFRLPVSGRRVGLRAPNGFDQALLAESGADGFALRAAVVKRLAPPDPEDGGWDELPAADVDAALLALRRFVRGDTVIAEIDCNTCGSRGDLCFSIAGYLERLAPRWPRGLTQSTDGWIVGAGFRFRIPTVAAVLAVQDAASAVEQLERASIEAESARGRKQARAALAKIAPLVSGELEGACPACKTAQRSWFEPGEFVVEELRGLGAALLDETHLVASRYHWPEETILAMPATRRTAYAELILAELRSGSERLALI